MSTAIAHDPFLVDLQQLSRIASEPILRRGIIYHKENRVMDLAEYETCLTAMVEGSRDQEPYYVVITFSEDNELYFECDCPFEYEPVCKHIVATLLHYGESKRLREEVYDSAAEMAVAERRRRGKTEVEVELVSGHPAFGTWRARSLVQGLAQRSYEVHIRALDEKQNFCECMDHQTNLLGTCKHIEAAIHRANSMKKKHLALKKPAFVYLAWDVANAPKIRLGMGDSLTESTRQLVERFFDAEDQFRFDPAESFYEFRILVEDREDLLVGIDVERYVRRLGDRRLMQERSRRIREELNASGGHQKGVRAQLYPYQREGVGFLAANGRALLADDMGLGKTLQAIAAAAWLRERGDVRSCLVICPASLKQQWAREIEKFTGLDTLVVQGSVAQRTADYSRRASFHIVNYELVLRDFDLISKSLAPDLMILDEAQRIKNFRTKLADSVRRVTTRYLFVLTGTPLENRLEDLYSLVQLIDPRILGPLWRFIPRYHVLDERGKVLGYRNLVELRRLLKPVMLRRDKSLIRAQLPDKIELRLDIEMDQRQKNQHDSALSSAMYLLQFCRHRKMTISEEKRFLAGLQQARMACDAAGLLDGVTVGSPKLSELKRLLEEICENPDQKVVIFSQWARMTAMAQDVCHELGLGSVRLHGGVPSKQRGAMVEAFWNDPQVRIFLSTDAGGTGLNLQRASVLINLDMPWNPAVLNQRIARVHRLGQQEPTRAILLLAANSYEQRVAQLLGGKYELFNSLMSEESEVDTVGVSRSMMKQMIEDLNENPLVSKIQIGPDIEVLAETAMASLEGDGEEAKPADLETTESGVNAAADERRAEPREALEPEPAAPSEGESEGEGEKSSETEPQLEVRIHEEPEPRAEDAYLNELVSALQHRLDSKLERMVVSHSGLLALVQELEPWMTQAVASLSDRVKVGVMTLKQFEILTQMGLLDKTKDVPTTQAKRLHVAKTDPKKELAQRKLMAAELLLSQELATEALAPISQALLLALSIRAQLATAPTPAEAVPWLYGKALASGILTREEAATATQALALSQAAEAPVEMVRELLAEAYRWLAALQ